MAQGTPSGIVFGLSIAMVSFLFVGVVFSGCVNFPPQALTYLYIIGPVSVIYLLKYILTISIAIRLQFLHRIIPVRTWEVVTYAAVASTPPFVDKAYCRMHLLAFILAIISPGLGRWGSITEYSVQRNVTVYGDTMADGIGGCDVQLARCYMTSNDLLVNQTRTLLAGKPFTYIHTDPKTGERFMPMWPLIPGYNNKTIGRDQVVYITMNNIPGAVFYPECTNMHAEETAPEAVGNRITTSSRRTRDYDTCGDNPKDIWAGLPGLVELDVSTAVDNITSTYSKVLNITMPGPNMYMLYTCEATIQMWYMDAVWLLDKGTIQLVKAENKRRQILEYNKRLALDADQLRVVYSNTFGYIWDHQSMTTLEVNRTIPKLFDAHIQTLIMRASGMNSSLFVSQVVKNATFTFVEDRKQPGLALTITSLATAAAATLFAAIWLALYFFYSPRSSPNGPRTPLHFTGNLLQLLELFKNDPSLLSDPFKAIMIQPSPHDHGHQANTMDGNVQPGNDSSEEGDVCLVAVDLSAGRKARGGGRGGDGAALLSEVQLQEGSEGRRNAYGLRLRGAGKQDDVGTRGVDQFQTVYKMRHGPIVMQAVQAAQAAQAVQAVQAAQAVQVVQNENQMVVYGQEGREDGMELQRCHDMVVQQQQMHQHQMQQPFNVLHGGGHVTHYPQYHSTVEVHEVQQDSGTRR